MTFDNPAAAASNDAARYAAALLARLGDRDPLAVLAEHADAVEAAVAGLDERSLRRPEAPGKWSLAEVVGHLADTELVNRYRLRRMVAQPGVAIEAYDQDAWAGGLRYASDDVGAALALLRHLRSETLRWVGSLTSDERARGGVHAERGFESVDRLLALLAGHDLVHRDQIARIRRAIGAG